MTLTDMWRYVDYIEAGKIICGPDVDTVLKLKKDAGIDRILS